VAAQGRAEHLRIITLQIARAYWNKV